MNRKDVLQVEKKKERTKLTLQCCQSFKAEGVAAFSCRLPLEKNVHPAAQVPLELSSVFQSSEEDIGGKMLGKWQTPCQVIPVDKLLHKEGMVRGGKEGQREKQIVSEMNRGSV